MAHVCYSKCISREKSVLGLQISHSSNSSGRSVQHYNGIIKWTGDPPFQTIQGILANIVVAHCKPGIEVPAFANGLRDVYVCVKIFVIEQFAIAHQRDDYRELLELK